MYTFNVLHIYGGDVLSKYVFLLVKFITKDWMPFTNNEEMSSVVMNQTFFNSNWPNFWSTKCFTKVEIHSVKLRLTRNAKTTGCKFNSRHLYKMHRTLRKIFCCVFVHRQYMLRITIMRHFFQIKKKTKSLNLTSEYISLLVSWE